MILEKPEPLVIEATTQKEFPHEWVYSFTVMSPSISQGRARFELLPYNSTTKEIGEGKYMEVLDVQDLFDCVTNVPEAAIAYKAILEAIGPVREYIKTKNTETTTIEQ